MSEQQRRTRRRVAEAVAELSAEEKAEIELGEQARIAADDWSGGVAPGKAAHFGPSFRRLLGLLRPHAVAFTVVSLLGAAGVVLAVLSPKVLGEATNILFEGVVSSMADERGRPDLRTLLADRSERLFHVGRLDTDTSGLLLVTNDGEFAHKLAHPSFEVTKTYVALVQGTVDDAVGRLFRRRRRKIDIDRHAAGEHHACRQQRRSMKHRFRRHLRPIIARSCVHSAG